VEKGGSVLVVGGGVAGMQASLDLADRGFRVYLVEKTPSIGGRMSQLDKTFPTMDCSICILAPKMLDVARRENIVLLTYSEIKEVKGEPGNFNVKILKKARFVDSEKCTSCGDCIEVCPVIFPREFDMNLGTRKAIFRPFPQAVPNIFTIDKKGTPKCQAACPAGVNVQGYVALINQGKFDEALELIRSVIPFPGVCGRVCYHPCETECERGNVDEPVAINALKRFVSDYELKNRKKDTATPLPISHKEKIAIIGSGPTGLTAAYDLVRMGYPVTVFESLSKPGGMLRVGIPDFRLPSNILDAEIDRIRNLGVEIKTNITVGEDLLFNDIVKDHDAVLIASGWNKGAKLGVEGEELEGVINAIDFLREVNLGKSVELGNRVAIICVHRLLALDSTRVALRSGPAEVNVIYRRSRKRMLHHAKAGEHIKSELEEAEKEGAKFQFMIWPTRILGKGGRVTGIEYTRMALGEPDKSGKRRWTPINGSEFTSEVDTVILAVGQAQNSPFLPKEIELEEKGAIKVNPITLETSITGVFAGGEAQSGPATAIGSIALGKRAAISIDRFLRGEDMEVGREIKEKLVGDVSTEGIQKKARQVMPILPTEKRKKSFDELVTGFTQEMALEESERCLKCGGCSVCLECEKVCEPKAIMHDQKDQIIEVNVRAIILATGFDPFDPSGIKEYGYSKYQNVLSSMDLERLLSASGPTSGHLLRPSDKKTPLKIAFIQCVGSRSLKGEYPYCSSVCCMYATKEAALIKEHESDSDIYIFHTDIRAFGKGFREFVNRAKLEWGMKYIRAKPSELREDPKTKNLLIKYEETQTGEIKTLQAELVILCTALVPSQDNRKLADIMAIEVDQFGFFEVPNQLQVPMDSTSPGIFLCGCCQGPKDIPDSIAQAKGAAAKAAEFIAQTDSVEAAK